MRLLSSSALVAIALACAACPGTQSPGDDDTDAAAPVDAGTDAPVNPVCENPVPTCEHTVRYTNAAATSVILRGDFAADGWTTGIPMQRNGDAWEVTIPAADQQVVVYKLVVDGTWQADPANPRRSPDGFGGQNSVVRIDCDQCPARPTLDWRDAVLYFVMIDRFANGNPGNDAPIGNLEPPAEYQGGDFAGLRQKIEEGYFDSLGVNALWITSPLDNADFRGRGSDGHDYSGYHGYWPRDLDAVESRLGTEAELKAVIDAAHARNINVILDYVMNHVADDSPTYQQHPDWFWPNDNGRGGDCVCGGGCNWDDGFERKKCWFTSYLPDFDFRNGDARRYSIANAIAWAQRLGADGFRLDAVKHIEDAWLTDLRGRLDGEVEWDQVFYLVGETYTGDRDLIRYYVNPDTMLDGQFDFPLRAELLSKILRRAGSMQDLASFLSTNDTYYGPRAVMSTFIGNHDVPRTVHFAEDTPLFADWDDGKFRAWNNPPGLPPSPNPFERLAVAYTFLYTSPGVPLVYYGDEIGLPGAGDPDNRRFMQWSGYSTHQTFLRDRLARLGAIRRDHAALRRGTRTMLGTTTHTMVYEMVSPGDHVYVALNRADQPEAAQGLPAGDYEDLTTGQMVRAPFSISPRTGMVLVPR
jgi:glycosidase